VRDGKRIPVRGERVNSGEKCGGRAGGRRRNEERKGGRLIKLRGHFVLISKSKWNKSAQRTWRWKKNIYI